MKLATLKANLSKTFVFENGHFSTPNY